jgi:branched-chain amino acid transport system ATP-binding protein
MRESSRHISADSVLLSIADVVAGYEEIQVLAGVTLDIRRGEIATIIGPNGAGKSTLLKAVFGLVRVWQGTISYEDTEIHNRPSAELLRKGIALVLQGRVNFPLMTVDENLQMGAFVRRDRGIRRDINRLCERFPMLGEKRRELAGNLSGGQQQILEMAMALVMNPLLLMLDEPSLGLSPKMTDEVFKTVIAIRGDGATVLMVEQNAKAALNISDHGIVLELGRKRFEGTGYEIFHDPQVKKAYLGG